MSKLLDQFDAAALLAITPRQLNRLVRRNEIPHVQILKGEIRFSEQDLAEFVVQHRQPATEARR